MEYLITEQQFNKKYPLKKKKLRIRKRRSEKYKKSERKEREYKKRIPKKYNLYIKSEFWRLRKNKYYKNHKRLCVICFSSNYCDLHHIVYENSEFGFEKDENLVCLCRDCHEEYHAIYGSEGNMHDNFAEFCYNKVNNPIII